MISKYSVDLEKFSLTQFRELLRKTELLPSQKILKDKLDKGFDAIEKEGITNLSQLQTTLKDKSDVTKFAKKTSMSEDFFIILRREINSYSPKERKLNEFPYIDSKLVSKLQALNIKDTQDFFERTATISDRTTLAQSVGMGMEPIVELTRLSDVTRLRYVSQPLQHS